MKRVLLPVVILGTLLLKTCAVMEFGGEERLQFTTSQWTNKQSENTTNSGLVSDGFVTVVQSVLQLRISLNIRNISICIPQRFKFNRSSIRLKTATNVNIHEVARNHQATTCLGYHSTWSNSTRGFISIIQFNETNDQIILMGSHNDFQLIFEYQQINNTIRHESEAGKLSIHFSIIESRVKLKDVLLPLSKDNSFWAYSNCGVRGVYSYSVNDALITQLRNIWKQYGPYNNDEFQNTHYKYLNSYKTFISTTLADVKLQVSNDVMLTDDDFDLRTQSKFHRNYDVFFVRREKLLPQQTSPHGCLKHEFQLRKIATTSRFLSGVKLQYIVWRFMQDKWTYKPTNYTVTILNFENYMSINYTYACDQGDISAIKSSLNVSSVHMPCFLDLCHTFPDGDGDATTTHAWNDGEMMEMNTTVCVNKKSRKICRWYKQIDYEEPIIERLDDAFRTRLILLPSCGIILVMIVTSIFGFFLPRRQKGQEEMHLLKERMAFLEEIDERCDLLYERYM